LTVSALLRIIGGGDDDREDDYDATDNDDRHD
jgi:hypothetical protein